MLALSLICLNLIVKDKCSRLDKAYLKLIYNSTAVLFFSVMS